MEPSGWIGRERVDARTFNSGLEDMMDETEGLRDKKDTCDPATI